MSRVKGFTSHHLKTYNKNDDIKKVLPILTRIGDPSPPLSIKKVQRVQKVWDNTKKKLENSVVCPLLGTVSPLD